MECEKSLNSADIVGCTSSTMMNCLVPKSAFIVLFPLLFAGIKKKRALVRMNRLRINGRVPKLVVKREVKEIDNGVAGDGTVAEGLNGGAVITLEQGIP